MFCFPNLFWVLFWDHMTYPLFLLFFLGMEKHVFSRVELDPETGFLPGAAQNAVCACGQSASHTYYLPVS